MSDIIKSLPEQRNSEIASSVGLTKRGLELLLNSLSDTYYLDGRIENISKIMHDETIEPIERIATGLKKFSRISESEVITPENICNEMVKDLGDDIKKGKVLDIASKAGEFALATYKAMKRKGVSEKIIKNSIYSIPTSKIAYEFTRKMYEALNLNIDNIATKVKAYDIIDNKNLEETKRELCQDKKFSEIELGQKYFKKGDGEVKFSVVIGNPPYQGENHRQIYTDFYLSSRAIGENSILIFPTGWQEPKNANNLSKLNKKEIKEDKQIVFIDNKHNVFPGVPGAEWTNIVLWKKGFDNHLHGAQKVLTEGRNETTKKLLYRKQDIVKPKEIVLLAETVKKTKGFKSLQTKTSVLKPYGLRTDVFKDYRKYNLEPLQDKRQNKDDILIWAISATTLFVPKNYKFPKKTKAFSKYKVFVPYAWGNWAEKNGLGGSFSDIVIGFPQQACTETYLESGEFDDYDTAKKHAKYLMTKFLRALLYLRKYSQHSTTSWGAIPIQSYKEKWWDESIEKIDEKLFQKYNIPDEVKQFVYKNIQTRTEKNIINFK